MTNTNRIPASANPALGALVEELLTFGGFMTQIIDHMARFMASARPSPDAPPFDVVLQGLLTDILTPLARQASSADIETTTAMLKRVAEAIEAEIVLVPPEALERMSADG